MQYLKFGIFDHLDDAGIGTARQYEERLRLAEACDAVRFHAYHVAEHHGTPHGLAPSPNLFLAAMAQRTTHLRLGPLVMLLNLYHPLRAFEEICMLDQLSGGRVEFGMGRGSVPTELGFFGVSAGEAQSRYREAADVVLKAMAGGTLNHSGQYFDLRDVPISLAPVQQPHPPIWVGAMQPETGGWAADNAMNIACVGGTGGVRAITDTYRARWQARAEDSAAMPLLGMLRMIVIADTDTEAYALGAPAYDRWFDTFTHLARQRGLPSPPMLPTTFEAACDSGLAIVGSATTVLTALRAQISDAGVNYLLCHIAFGSLPFAASLLTVSAIASEIMPHFADLALDDVA